MGGVLALASMGVRDDAIRFRARGAGVGLVRARRVGYTAPRILRPATYSHRCIVRKKSKF